MLLRHSHIFSGLIHGIEVVFMFFFRAGAPDFYHRLDLYNSVNAENCFVEKKEVVFM